MKPPIRSLILTLLALAAPVLQAGNLKVTLSPAQAVTAGAQWRVDGGAWRNSGTTVNSLSNTTHPVDFKTATGWIVPAPFNVTLSGNSTTSKTGTYVQAAALKVTLTPSNGTWRVDGGAWTGSGATVGGLAPGSHTIDYSTLTGYNSPATETATLAAGQTQTLSRGYTVTPAAVKVTLTPANGMWRVDGGAWTVSGATVGGFTPGTHTISYSALPGYITPATETATLTAGQTLTLTRTYTLSTASLTVNLTPANGTWRIDGGAWTASAAMVNGLAPGSHTIDYAALSGYDSPATETVTLTAGQTQTLSRIYTVAPAALNVTLTPAGTWQIDGGAWTASGATLGGLTPGGHTIAYSTLSGYTTPATETVTLTAGQTLSLSRNYTVVPAALSVTLTPACMWKIDGGAAWQFSGSTVSGLTPGDHTITYGTFSGYSSPPAETVTLISGQTLSLSRSYTPLPPEMMVTLTPANGMWQLDGGAWIASGVTVTGLAPGSHNLAFSTLPGYTSPVAQTVNLSMSQSLSLSRSYTLNSGSLTVNLTPAIGQWRVDAGAWQAGGATVTSLAAGSHTVTYDTVPGYVAPATETVALTAGQSRTLDRAYQASAQLLIVTQLKCATASGAAQWRLDSGAWQPCGVEATVIAGTHTLEFKPVAGWDVPPSSSVNLPVGELTQLEVDYFMPHRLRFFINQDLTTGLTLADIQTRLSQYAAHLQTIWHRETARRFTFNPATDITICTADPFSWSYTGTQPNVGFEMWIYARLTDNPAYGTYGGNCGLDVSGAGGAANLKWDRIYDPSTLQPNTPEMMQYWRQVDHFSHEFAHSFGAGSGEYYELATLTDPTTVAPLAAPVSFSNPGPGDPFWGTRQEYWADPLLLNIYGQPRVGSPTALPDLLATVRFAPATIGVANSLCRSNTMNSLPDLSRVKVNVVDATTGLPIPGATCRVWNRRVDGTYNNFEQTVVATATPGIFEFGWQPYPGFNPMNNYDNAKIVKAWAPGYAPAAQWECIYDAQKAKTFEDKDIFEITVSLSAQ